MGELQSLQSLFGAREDALRTGILLDNRRYEVCRLYSACGASYDATQVSELGNCHLYLVKQCPFCNHRYINIIQRGQTLLCMGGP